MISEFAAAGKDMTKKFGVLFRAFAEREKRGAMAAARQDIDNTIRNTCDGTVVEGQRNAPVFAAAGENRYLRWNDRF